MTGSAAVLPDPFSTSLAGRRLGRYEVLARLASGGMAGVYVARALGVAGFERLFAVKVLHPHLAHEQEFITMFLDEARLAARIRHPNVVPTIDISDTQDAGYYLVMDYIEGDHLGALLAEGVQARHAPARTDRAAHHRRRARRACTPRTTLTRREGRALNLVHRDVSPHNIMVGTDGIARITDFGVAKAEVRLSTTREGQFKGKLAYMAPEHASAGEADQRSDLFSVAIILWECLTGRRLFRAENQAATLNKICIEPIPTAIIGRSCAGAVRPGARARPGARSRTSATRPPKSSRKPSRSAREVSAAWRTSAPSPSSCASTPPRRSIATVTDPQLRLRDLDSMQADGGSRRARAAGRRRVIRCHRRGPLHPRRLRHGHAQIDRCRASTVQLARARWPLWLLGTLALVAAGLALIALIIARRAAERHQLSPASRARPS